MFDTPIAIAQFILGLFGAITTIACFVPQGIKTFRTKNTSGLSSWFFVIALSSSAFWITIGVLAISNPYITGGNQDAISNGLMSGLPPIITNIVTVVINTMILIIKTRNIKQAKKLSMSEHDYCASLASASAVEASV